MIHIFTFVQFFWLRNDKDLNISSKKVSPSFTTTTS